MHSAALAEEYRSLQKSNPAKCGEWLKNLQTQYKLNQTQLAVKLKTNRQVIGRYLKTVKGKKKVKCHSVSRKDHAPVGSAISTEPSAPTQSLTWMGLTKSLTTPKSLSLLAGIATFTSYLIYQGALFFSSIDNNATSSITSAVVAELVPFAAAACLAVSREFWSRVLLTIVLIGSIAGMGLFMHDAISKQLAAQSLQNSEEYQRYQIQKQALESQITALSSSMNALPSSYATKRQDLAQSITQATAQLGTLSLDTAPAQSNSIALIFAVWLRVAAMVLNVLLVHGCFQLANNND